jgi:hypothetical protein
MALPETWITSLLQAGESVPSGRGRFSSRTIRIGLTPGQAEELPGVLGVDRGEHLEKLVEAVTVVEVIEQGLRRDPAGAEDERAPHHGGVGAYGALIQFDHDSSLTQPRGRVQLPPLIDMSDDRPDVVDSLCGRRE